MNVANANAFSRIVDTQMGNARLHDFDAQGTQNMVDIPNVPYSPSLPENLFSITQLYNYGFMSVDPNYRTNKDNLNMYLEITQQSFLHTKMWDWEVSANSFITRNLVRCPLNLPLLPILIHGTFDLGIRIVGAPRM